MKKILLFAAAALAMVACTKTEELNKAENKAQDESIKFEVYAQRGLATKAGVAGTNDNENIGTRGFGVFAYYTAGEKYDNNAKPNFMYNQKVEKKADAWVYEPVKYWPNEYGDAAVSEDVDYVTFFAYAPWTKFEPTTGDVTEDKEKNIISVNKNNATGDPIIKYVVDTDPATSVDLLWGVAASNAAANYSAIGGNTVAITTGLPFVDLVKPGKPTSDKLSFNLRHALAKVKFTIDYIADAETPNGTSKVINADETRIFVRSFTINGLAMKGALNLHNSEANKPLWKDFDGVKDLSFDAITFNDGRKDGREGDANGIQGNEPNQFLNPKIVENHALPTSTGFTDAKNSGVTNVPQLLFGGTASEDNGGYFYVIPSDAANEQVDVNIVYDVETIDAKLAALLSDNNTHGISIENVISKTDILGGSKSFEAGKVYTIKIHLGMTSVKIEASVQDWAEDVNEPDVNLPDNQIPYWTMAGSDMTFSYDPSADFVLLTSDKVANICDETSWNASYTSGKLKDYYTYYDAKSPYKEDLWNTVELRPANWNDIEKDNGNPIEYSDGYHYLNCERSWTGAIKAPQARYPWAVIELPFAGFDGVVKFVYDEEGANLVVYPFNGDENTYKTFPWGGGAASMGEEFAGMHGDDGYVSSSDFKYYGTDADSKENSWIMNPSTQVFPATLDMSKLKVYVKANPASVTYHAE